MADQIMYAMGGAALLMTAVILISLSQMMERSGRARAGWAAACLPLPLATGRF
ncbi:MAG: hypothetical protein WCE79_20840 [Xanthobacteraceae bacterium]